MSRGFWRLQDHHALVSCGALEAQVDVSRPDRGLNALQILGQPLADAQLLCVETPTTVGWESAAVDVYERGADLVATYAASDDWPFRLQIYWRVWIGEFAPAIAAVEMIVSLQTQLLDSEPRLFASSRLPAADVYQLVDADRGQFVRREPARPAHAGGGAIDMATGCDCALFRPPGLSWTYGEMTHPRGAVRSILSLDAGSLGADDLGGGLGRDVASEDLSAVGLLRWRHQLFAERLEKGVILRARVLAAFVQRSDERRSLASIYRDYAASDPPLTT